MNHPNAIASPRKSPLWATIQLDARTQFRHGFYLLSLLFLAINAAIWSVLPDAMSFFVPLILMTSMLLVAFVVTGLVLLTQREEGVLQGLYVTPLRPRDYLLAKIATLGGLGFLENMVLCVFAAAFFPISIHVPLAALGSALLAVLYSVLGLALLMRYRSFNELLLPLVAYAFFFESPELQYVGLPGGLFYYITPTQGPLLIFEAAVGRPLAAWQWIYAVLYPICWIVPAFAYALNNVQRYASSPWSGS